MNNRIKITQETFSLMLTHDFIYYNTANLVEALNQVKQSLERNLLRFSDKEFKQTSTHLFYKQSAQLYKSLLYTVTILYNHGRHDLDSLFDNATSDEERIAKGVFNNQIVKFYVIFLEKHIQQILANTKHYIPRDEAFLCQQMEMLNKASLISLETDLTTKKLHPMVDVETINAALKACAEREKMSEEMQENILELLEQGDPEYDEKTASKYVINSSIFKQVKIEPLRDIPQDERDCCDYCTIL